MEGIVCQNSEGSQYHHLLLEVPDRHIIVKEITLPLFVSHLQHLPAKMMLNHMHPWEFLLMLLQENIEILQTLELWDSPKKIPDLLLHVLHQKDLLIQHLDRW